MCEASGTARIGNGARDRNRFRLRRRRVIAAWPERFTPPSGCHSLPSEARQRLERTSRCDNIHVHTCRRNSRVWSPNRHSMALSWSRPEVLTCPNPIEINSTKAAALLFLSVARATSQTMFRYRLKARKASGRRSRPIRFRATHWPIWLARVRWEPQAGRPPSRALQLIRSFGVPN